MSAATPPTEMHEQTPRFAIACPTCDYLLHGLDGPMVTCPECGDQCDVEELARRYRSQWTTTPRYERMMRLVVLSLLGALASPFALLLLLPGSLPVDPMFRVLITLTIAGAALVWIALAGYAIRGMSIGRGIMLLLQLHMAFAGYLLTGVGIIAGFLALITLPMAVFNITTDITAVVMCATVILLGILSAFLMPQFWKLDQAVGKACLDYALPEVKQVSDRHGGPAICGKPAELRKPLPEPDLRDAT